MSFTISTLMLGGAGVCALIALGVRDHRKLRRSRHDLLGRCATVLDQARLSHGGDGFPRLDGHHTGRTVTAELIPDTMTIRRLPQLWLSVTLLVPLPVQTAFAILQRPSGNDFYSLTGSLPTQLDPPDGLPWEILIRGADKGAKPLLDRLAPALAAILSDARVKEIAVTAKGVRMVRQAAEGRRGEHLLLRQSVFDDAEVPAADLVGILMQLHELATETARASRALAADRRACEACPA